MSIILLKRTGYIKVYTRSDSLKNVLETFKTILPTLVSYNFMTP